MIIIILLDNLKVIFEKIDFLGFLDMLVYFSSKLSIIVFGKKVYFFVGFYVFLNVSEENSDFNILDLILMYS